MALTGLFFCLIDTDGGRISLAMFGRRGSFVVKLFTTLLLCAAGIFGLDEVNIFLTYVLFASIWQRELETPTRNEVSLILLCRYLISALQLLTHVFFFALKGR